VAERRWSSFSPEPKAHLSFGCGDELATSSQEGIASTNKSLIKVQKQNKYYNK
jgi:hypothetical protein